MIFFEKSLLGAFLKCTVFVRVEKQKQIDVTFLCAPGGADFFKIKFICIFVYTNSYTMAIVETTSRQFRERQKDFFDMVDKGKKVVIRRGSKHAYVLTPISQNDLYFSEEMIQRIKDAKQEIKEGKGITIKSKEDLDAYFDSL